MSSYDEAREAAQKCASSYTHLGMLTNGDAGATVSEMVDDILNAFLGHLSEAHAVVPREPTEAMVRALKDWVEGRCDGQGYAHPDVWGDAYRAMLAQEVKP